MLTPFIEKVYALWKWSVAVPNTPDDDLRNLHLRVFMNIVVIILGSLALSTLILFLVQTDVFATNFVLMCTLLTTIPYVLIRTGYTYTGIYLIQGLAYVLCIAWVMLNPEFPFYIVALVAAILIFSEFHGVRASLYFAVFCIVTGSLTIASSPVTFEQITAIMVLTMLAALVVMNRYMQAQVEDALIANNRRLSDSETRFKSIIEQAYEGIRIINADGIIIEWNKGDEYLTGLAREQVIGKPIWEIRARLSPEDRPYDDLIAYFKERTHEYIAQVQQGKVEKIEYENNIRHVDGSLRYLHHSAFPVNTADGVLICTITSDLTRKREDERRLRQLSKAVEQSPTSIVITDINGAIEYVNPKFTRLTGYTLEEAIGENPRILKTEHTRTEDYTNLWDMILNGQAWRGEFLNKKKNGEYYWELASISPITDDKGEITHFVAVKEDITEQKAIQEALQESEQRFRQMFENNQAVQLVIEPETSTIVDANPAAVAFYGYDRETLLSMSIYDINALSQAEIERDMRRVMDRDKLTFNFQHRLANGDVRDVEVFSTSIEIQDYVYLYSIIIDITKRVEAEQALRESEERFRQIAENINEVFYVRDPIDDKILYISPLYEQIWGHPVEETYANPRRFVDQVHPNDQPGLIQALQDEVEHEIMIDHEYRVIHPDGRLFWIWARNFPIYNNVGELYRIVGIAEDITESKLAEQALYNSEARYRALFERTNDAVFIFDLEFTILEANQRAADMLGYSIDELVGEKLWHFIAPEEVLHSQDRARAVIHGEEFPLYERVFVHKDGRQIITEVNIALVYDDDGYPKHVHSIVRDITPRKKAAEREITLKLEMQRRDILQRFIRDASHEFKTPLSTIETSLYLAEHTDDPERRAIQHEKLRLQIQRIVRLVDSLAKLVELDSIDNLSHTMPVDLRTTLNDLIRGLQEDTPQQFDIHIDTSLPSVRGRYDELALAFRHLLENAIRYTPADGTITVRACCDDARKMIEICIENTAHIADEDLPRIFERFYRADDSHTTPGFGLGLPMTRRILKLHGGEVTVTSDETTTFTITLPAEPVLA